MSNGYESMRISIVKEVVSAFPLGRKGEVCIKNSENGMSRSVSDFKACLCMDK